MASVLIKIQRSVVLTVIWKTSSQILDNIYSHNCWHGRCWELWWSPTTWPITIFNLGKEKTTTTKNPTYSERVFLNLAVDSLETAAEELKHFFARFEVSHPSQSPYQKREEEKKKKKIYCNLPVWPASSAHPGAEVHWETGLDHMSFIPPTFDSISRMTHLSPLLFILYTYDCAPPLITVSPLSNLQTTTLWCHF